mmetsp:Transcript_80217/g.232896  ORF Transcript_80217/g.232896 Transcript_80217/m.232896 type:complete len:113 (+) Transcript_80217:136-474(+)
MKPLVAAADRMSDEASFFVVRPRFSGAIGLDNVHGSRLACQAGSRDSSFWRLDMPMMFSLDVICTGLIVQVEPLRHMTEGPAAASLALEGHISCWRAPRACGHMRQAGYHRQ